MDEPSRDRVQRMVSLSRPPEDVWAEIGGFGAQAHWHPSVAEIEEVELDGAPHRHVTLADGTVLLERLIDTGPHHYTCTLIDGPLPVDDYRSTLSCVAEPGGCHVFWSAIFEADDPGIDELIARFFEIGLNALRERYEGASGR